MKIKDDKPTRYQRNTKKKQKKQNKIVTNNKSCLNVLQLRDLTKKYKVN